MGYDCAHVVGVLFTHSEPARLEAAAEQLTELGLKCVGVQLAEKKSR